MSQPPSWLCDVVVVNESGDIRQGGDVLVFRTPADMLRYLEPWWVENNEGFAFTVTGEHLTLGANYPGVVVLRREWRPDGEAIVRDWLLYSARHVLEGRRARARKGKLVLSDEEERGVLPETIEELIIYVGFNR